MSVGLSIYFYRYINANAPHNRGLHNIPQNLTVQKFLDTFPGCLRQYTIILYYDIPFIHLAQNYPGVGYGF